MLLVLCAVSKTTQAQDYAMEGDIGNVTVTYYPPPPPPPPAYVLYPPPPEYTPPYPPEPPPHVYSGGSGGTPYTPLTQQQDPC